LKEAEQPLVASLLQDSWLSQDWDARWYCSTTYEPEDLFRHRPVLQFKMSLQDMDQAIAAAVNRADP
jgi:hypothetical protein